MRSSKRWCARNVSQKLPWRTLQMIRRKPLWRTSCAERDLPDLAEIHPQAGAVFRPLLGVRREDLRKYLRAKHQRWREDITNLDTKQMRARIRQKLMPLLQKSFQPAVVEHLCQLAELAQNDKRILTRRRLG